MAGPDGLVEWLNACVDADEQAARAASPGPWRAAPCVYGPPEDGWGEPSEFEIIGADGRDVVSHQPHEGGGIHHGPDAEHIALHDPARVLAQVAAHRAILELHTPGDYSYCDECDRAWPCNTLLQLATAYADRDGYDPQWRPERWCR